MVNYIWVAMTAVGVIYALFNGTMDQVTQAIFEGASEAVTLCLGLVSMLVFWLGLMRVAQDAGLLAGLTRLLVPLIRRIFPEVPRDHPAMGYILSNMTANLLGWATRPRPWASRPWSSSSSLTAEEIQPADP